MFYISVDFTIPKNGMYRDVMRKQAFLWNMGKEILLLFLVDLADIF